jgi:hypothetical protein
MGRNHPFLRKFGLVISSLAHGHPSCARSAWLARRSTAATELCLPCLPTRVVTLVHWSRSLASPPTTKLCWERLPSPPKAVEPAHAIVSLARASHCVLAVYCERSTLVAGRVRTRSPTLG